MGRFIDLTGRRFGRLSVTGRAEPLGYQIRWQCLCDCGAGSVVLGFSLRRGETKSCGCLRREVAGKNTKRQHGHSHSPTYRTWVAMHQRCVNPKTAGYSNYGGRGISVCSAWADFNAFLADMGPRPTDKSLDRIDVNGNYEPANCRWATIEQQASNKRNNVFVSLGGRSVTASEAARSLSVDVRHMHYLVRRYGDQWGEHVKAGRT